ncbi:MAG: sce7726 family protein [Pseudomonadota bacterium]
MTSIQKIPTKRARLGDKDVREAVLSQVLREHRRDPNVRVVEELGLENGATRVDIAVINGFLHGYELKSESDNLLRLPHQVESYGRCLDRVTIVVAAKHVQPVLEIIPEWWGIKVASPRTRGGVQVETLRSLQNNPAPSLLHMARLLWREEVIALLQRAGALPNELQGNRATLYARLVEKMPSIELRRAIRETVRCRENWRDYEPLL